MLRNQGSAKVEVRRVIFQEAKDPSPFKGCSYLFACQSTAAPILGDIHRHNTNASLGHLGIPSKGVYKGRIKEVTLAFLIKGLKPSGMGQGTHPGKLRLEG